jgi:toxin ParE1/3/4
MEFKIIVSPSAQLDIEEIADFYFNININVLIQFNKSLKEAYSSLSINPYYQKRYKDFHGIPLKQFPFMLFYKIEKDNRIVKIISCFHTSQNPKKYPI